MVTSNKILVTGFEPFLGEKLNPSELIIQSLKAEFNTELETLLLPVAFSRAAKDVAQCLRSNDYKLVLMLGQAGGRSKINFERVALNWIETEYPDEEGFKPEQGFIFANESPALFTSLPLNQWRDHLAQKFPVEISLSAGGYVCNFIYYHVLQIIKNENLSTQACFIHVPYLPEQVVNKPMTASLEFEVMRNCIGEVLQWHMK